MMRWQRRGSAFRKFMSRFRAIRNLPVYDDDHHLGRSSDSIRKRNCIDLDLPTAHNEPSDVAESIYRRYPAHGMLCRYRRKDRTLPSSVPAVRLLERVIYDVVFKLFYSSAGMYESLDIPSLGQRSLEIVLCRARALRCHNHASQLRRLPFRAEPEARNFLQRLR